MPAIITHYTFARDVSENAGVTGFEQAFYLGAQGPDPFFFFGQLNKRENKKDVQHYGARLHHMDFSEVYSELLAYASKSEHKDLLSSYIKGLFCHYAMDRNCHPYIFYRSGVGEGKEKKPFEAAHACLETYIDILLGKRKGTFTPHMERYLDVPEEQLQIISKMWYDVNKKTLDHPSLKEDSFYLANKDYQKTLSFLNHPRWFKKILVTLIQGKASQAYALIYPKHFEGEREDLDYLNDKREVWKEPSTKKERKESFEQLYQKSAKDFYSILPTLEKGLAGEDVLKDIVSYVDDIDHDGKKNGSEVLCFSSIWPSYPGTSVKDFEK